MIIEFKEPMVSISKSEFDARMAETKAEVAREIFAEIEKWLAYDGDIRMITNEKFAEIKKKYTEVNT